MGVCVRVGEWIFVEEGGGVGVCVRVGERIFVEEGGVGGCVEKGETSIPD